MKPALTFLAALLSASIVQAAEDNSVYQVRVNSKAISVDRANVWEPGYVPSYGGPYWFCSFDLTGEAIVEVSTVRPLDKLAVLPESRGVTARVAGAGATLKIQKPAQLAFEPDGKNGPLLIFANPPETTAPTAGDPNVKYFGPGVHDAGAIMLTDNQTLYLAAGAIVRGGIHARGPTSPSADAAFLTAIPIRDSKGPLGILSCLITAAM